MQIYQILHHYRKNAFYAIRDLEEQEVWQRELTFHHCGFYRVPGSGLYAAEEIQGLQPECRCTRYCITTALSSTALHQPDFVS
eukprot:1973955-Pleurochrysis_carterae.AAC.1